MEAFTEAGTIAPRFTAFFAHADPRTWLDRHADVTKVPGLQIRRRIVFCIAIKSPPVVPIPQQLRRVERQHLSAKLSVSQGIACLKYHTNMAHGSSPNSDGARVILACSLMLMGCPNVFLGIDMLGCWRCSEIARQILAKRLTHLSKYLVEV